MAKSKSKNKSKKEGKKKAKPAAKKAIGKTAGKTGKKGIGQPYGDRVLVRPTVAEQTTSFGIIIPDNSKESPETGVVVAVGEGKQTAEGKIIPLRVKAGDKIMFSKYSHDEVTINGTEYYLIREDSITYIL